MPARLLPLLLQRWITFQLLHGLSQAHVHGVCHGDIKCENILLSSCDCLYLVDFASSKPVYIVRDDPVDFSFFFDSAGRRTCYLAPERFISAELAASRFPRSSAVAASTPSASARHRKCHRPFSTSVAPTE